MSRRLLFSGLLTACVFSMASVQSHANQTISLLNPSFESPTVDPQATPAVPVIDFWTEFELPGPGGDQVAGVFPNTTAITNVDGSQLAFINAFPDLGIAVAQSSADLYQAGWTYTASVWLGKSSDTAFGDTPPDTASLIVRLYYGSEANALNPAFELASQTVSAADLPITELLEVSFDSAAVLPTDPWFGQPIGLAFLPSGVNTNLANFNTFNVDNASITAVPEPTTLALVGLGALAAVRRRRN